ncbi:MAG: BTAD domain-containing putative transcriptional regulator [Chloroflexota bacterium]
MTSCILYFLGRFEVIVDKTPVIDFHSDKARALLSYLALEPQIHPRTVLATLLWPEIGDKHARTNLRNTLHRLRQTLDSVDPGVAEQVLMVTRQTVQFNIDNALIDVLRFQKLSDVKPTQTDSAVFPQEQIPSDDPARSSLDALNESLALYQGELLPGLNLADAPPFEEWLLLYREMLHQRALLAFRTLTTDYESTGNYEQAYAVVSRLLTLDPYREESYRQMMRLLALLGQPEQSLKVLDKMRQLFRRELDDDPSEETLALAQEIANGVYDKATSDRVTTSEDDKVSKHHPTPTASSSRHRTSSTSPPSTVATALPKLHDIPNPGLFFGRIQERQQIIQWLLHDRCHIAAILGIGGMGKTSLAAQCARELAHETSATHFDVIIWRSLLNAPPLEELLPPLLQILSDPEQIPPTTSESHRGPANINVPRINVPKNLDEQLRLLMGCLSSKRVLLVLDNMESILEAGLAGHYLPGYEPYGHFLTMVITHTHDSSVLITTREIPSELVRAEGDTPLVRSLQLDGLNLEAGRELLAERGLVGTAGQESELIHRYSGNPLALKLVADTVDDLYFGDVDEFLSDEAMVFDDIRKVLDQQFARLSELEQDVLYWLAIQRESTSLGELRQKLLHRPSQRALIEAIRTLQRRSLIERKDTGFTLQNVVIEYLTGKLIDTVCTEIQSEEYHRLNRYPLIDAQTKEYIRHIQTRLLLAPIGNQLLDNNSLSWLKERVKHILSLLRESRHILLGYSGGNLLNLLLLLDVDVEGFDFSHLSIWQAYLQGQRVCEVDFSGSDLATSVFTDIMGPIFDLAFSPDGKEIAIATGDGEIRLHRLADRTLIRSFPTDENRPIHAVAFGMDGQTPGQTLIGTSGERTICIWDKETGRIIQKLSGHQGIIQTIACNIDGIIASGDSEKTICLWDAHTGKLHHTLTGHSDWVNKVVFSPDGQTLASASFDKTVRLWETSTGETVHIFDGHEQIVRAAAFDADGRFIATGGEEHVVRVWNVAQGKIQYECHGHTSAVWSVAFSPDGKLLASAGADNTAHVWELDEPSPESTQPQQGSKKRAASVQDNRKQAHHVLRGHTQEIRVVVFSPDGGTIATGSADQRVRLWDARAGKPLSTIQGHADLVNGLAFSLDGRTLAYCCEDLTVGLWDVNGVLSEHNSVTGPVNTSPGNTQEEAKLCTILPNHMHKTNYVAFSPDSTLLACCCTDGLTRLWNRENATLQQTLQADLDQGMCGGFSPNGQALAVGHSDSSITLWNCQSGQIEHLLQQHTEMVTSVIFSPDSETLASTSFDHQVYLWDVQSGEVLRSLTAHTNIVWAADFSPDGQRLVTGGNDQTVRVWDVQTGQNLFTCQGHTHMIFSVAFSPDGTIIASGSYDYTLRLWDAKTGQILQTLEGPDDMVRILAFSPDGTFIATGSSGRIIRLWDVQTGHCIRELQAPGPYAGTNISGVTGISEAQRASLLALGAVAGDG